MLISIAVFASLSVISFAIFVVERVSHQRMLRKCHMSSEDFLSGRLQPILVTNIRRGMMQESYYYIPDGMVHPYGKANIEVEQALFKRLVNSTQFSVN